MPEAVDLPEIPETPDLPELPELAEMKHLVAWLNEESYRYYSVGESVVSDKEWDARYDQLSQMEKACGVVLADSPTRRVGAAPLSAFEPHRHSARLWSMDKAQSEEAVIEWAARAQKLRAQAVEQGLALPAMGYVVEHKFDGLTINLTYEGGRLIEAATRGNGEVGEAILPQATTIRSIPLSIPFKGRMEVHGEAYMRLSVLEAYNKVASEPLKNARNGAAGALRNLDPGVTAQRKLSAAFYNVGYIEGKRFADHADMLAFLEENHLPISECAVYAGTIEDAMRAVREIEQTRGALDYLIDGAVIKVRDFETREALGYTDKFPRWAVAYKFEAEEVTSTLEDVIWTPGRTGKLTPLAHLSPVELAGATISRATLNNYGDILRKRVRLGAKVWVRRSNEVIPEIMGRVDDYSAGEREVEKPTVCPACGAALVERGAHLFCPNRDGCEPQIVARLSHFASRDAMDIDTLSEKTARQFYRTLGVTEPSELYALTLEQLSGLERFAEKKATKLLAALQKSKRPALDAFLFALGIPNVGRKTARDLATRFGSVEALKAARREALIEVGDVGEIVASGVMEFFEDEKNWAQVEALFDAGVVPEQVEAAASGALMGMSVVVTGTLEKLSRQEAEALIEGAGGKAASAVSKKTSFVLAGEKAGSKLKKALELGVPVLDEAQFLAKINAQTNDNML
ncbi:MAG: NAD-dependent DNA ligase LigA [Clostridia bacterium]